MKKYALLFVLFMSLQLIAQIDIQDHSLRGPCDFDSLIVIDKYVFWDIYQTVDNTHNGDRIPNCIPVINSRFGIEKLDLTKKLFVSTNNNYKPEGINPNSIYSMMFSFSSTPNGIFDQNCESCQKVFFYTSMPNATMDGINHEVSDFDLSFPFGSSFLSEICFPTANVLDQKLDRVVFEITIDSTANKNAQVRFNGLFGHEGSEVNLMLNDITLPISKFNNKSTRLRPSELILGNFFQLVIVTHNKGYPSSSNKDFKEIKIDPNPSEPYTISIESQFFENVVFQKYTGIRGGIVEGQDSLRHNVELTLENPLSCALIIGDLIFGGGSSFRYISGEINLRERNSCLMFKENSTMTVERNSNLHYGNKGRGMLALFDAKVNVKDDAKMIMDGQIVLKAGIESPHIYLDGNSQLQFSKHSKVWVIDNNDQVVYIHAKLDQVDLSLLDEVSRSHIIIVEEEIQPNELNQLICYPNPSNGKVYFKGNSNGDTCTVLDLQGRIVNSQIIEQNAIELPSDLQSGMYILEVKGVTTKLVVR